MQIPIQTLNRWIDDVKKQALEDNLTAEQAISCLDWRIQNWFDAENMGMEASDDDSRSDTY